MNPFLSAMRERAPLLGLWQSLGAAYTAEICAQTGFDWLMFDGEHAPNTIVTLLAQLQAVSAYPVLPIARPPVADPAIIKQYLDIGFDTLLLPMIDSAGQARQAVAAMQFPPRGIRGVASATSRASAFGLGAQDYLVRAHERTAAIVQIESRPGLESVEEIAAVEGVDALFIGPADLSASLGHLGNPRHAEVQSAIGQAFEKIRKAGKPAGIFALDLDDATTRIAQGFSFVSLGTDIGILAQGARQLLFAVDPQNG